MKLSRHLVAGYPDYVKSRILGRIMKFLCNFFNLMNEIGLNTDFDFRPDMNKSRMSCRAGYPANSYLFISMYQWVLELYQKTAWFKM